MTISKKEAKYFLLLLPFFEPQCAFHYPLLSKLYSIAFYGILFYFAVYWFMKMRRNEKPNAISLALLGLELTVFASTYYHHGDLREAWAYFKNIALLAFVIEYLAKDIELLIKTIFRHSEICIYINFLSILAFPNGMISKFNEAYGATKEWFLGSNHFFYYWLIVGLCIAFIYKEIGGNKTRCNALILCALLTQFIQGSKTGLVGVCVLFLLVHLPLRKQLLKPRLLIIAYIICSVLIVIINDTEFLEPLVVGVLNKDLTFNGRILIWNNAVNYIIHNPVLGGGLLDAVSTAKILGLSPAGTIWIGATHCHNQILQIAFIGGSLALSLFIISYFLTFRKLFSKIDNKVAYILFCSLFCILLMGTTEVLEKSEIYMVLLISWYVEPIIQIQTQKERRYNED